MRLTDKINKIKYAATHHFHFLKKGLQEVH